MDQTVHVYIHHLHLLSCTFFFFFFCNGPLTRSKKAALTHCNRYLVPYCSVYVCHLFVRVGGPVVAGGGGLSANKFSFSEQEY